MRGILTPGTADLQMKSKEKLGARGEAAGTSSTAKTTADPSLRPLRAKLRREKRERGDSAQDDKGHGLTGSLGRRSEHERNYLWNSGNDAEEGAGAAADFDGAVVRAEDDLANRVGAAGVANIEMRNTVNATGARREYP
jgi:hypothetical protein